MENIRRFTSKQVKKLKRFYKEHKKECNKLIFAASQIGILYLYGKNKYTEGTRDGYEMKISSSILDEVLEKIVLSGDDGYTMTKTITQDDGNITKKYYTFYAKCHSGRYSLN